MTNAKAAHESRNFFLEGPAGRLEAILWKPAAPPSMTALVCHPHPLFGGTMHNKVVYQAAKTLDALGLGAMHSFGYRWYAFRVMPDVHGSFHPGASPPELTVGGWLADAASPFGELVDRVVVIDVWANW